MDNQVRNYRALIGEGGWGECFMFCLTNLFDRDLIFFVRVRAYEKSVTGMEPLKGI